MPIVVSPWEVRFKNHTIFGQTAKEALSHAKEEIERCEAKGLSWDLHCKSPQEVAIEESYNKIIINGNQNRNYVIANKE